MGSIKKIIVVAGEASGDMHAAHLVDELKKADPSLIFSGLGGPKMQQSGVFLYEDLTKIAVVGFIEVLKHYKEIKKAFDLILQKVDELKPACVILVDYPGFNLRLAKELKKRNVKVIYYISPQVWAWKEKRVYQIKENVNLMLVLFEFEQELYRRYGIASSFVGHPLIDMIHVETSKEDLLHSVGLADYKLTIGILPGSRAKEVEVHLPIMLEAARALHQEFPMLQFLLIQAPTVSKEMFESALAGLDKFFPLKVIEGKTYDAIHACNLCMVTSGTATLETAILQKPMVVVYKTSFLTWALAKLLIKIPNIGLVNVVAGKRVVPECIQFQATPHHIAKELKNIFTNEIKIADIKADLRRVKESLGPPGASHRAAQEIISVLN